MKAIVFAGLLCLGGLFGSVSRGEQMVVSGAENGQGYVFGVYDRCFVVTAGHILDKSVAGQVRLTVHGASGESFTQTSPSTGIPGNIGVWASPADVVVLQLHPDGWSPCASGGNATFALPDAPGAIILDVDDGGTVHFVPVDVTGSGDGVVLFKGRPPAGSSCNLQRGLSGSLALDESKKIVGILTSIVSARCVARVVPLAAINDLLKDDSFQLPIHPLSQQLTEAIRANDYTKYSELIKNVGDPNGVDAIQRSPMGMVVNDARAPYPGYDDDTPAKKQAKQQACDLWVEARLQIARDLVRRGADVNFSGAPNGWTPLMETAFGNPGCVGVRLASFLISANADLDRRFQNSETALHMTVGSTFNLPVLKVLLAAGANPNLRDEFGDTPIMSLVDAKLYDVHNCEDDGSNDDQWTVAFKMLSRYSDMDMTLPDKGYGDTGGKTVQAYLRERYGHETPGFDRCMRSIFHWPKND